MLFQPTVYLLSNSIFERVQVGQSYGRKAEKWRADHWNIYTTIDTVLKCLSYLQRFEEEELKMLTLSAVVEKSLKALTLPAVV